MNMKTLWILLLVAAFSITAVSAYWLGVNNGSGKSEEDLTTLSAPKGRANHASDKSEEDLTALSAPKGQSASVEPSVLYWYDPMVPDQHFDKPGKSPFMDMDLVPKYADSDSSATVKVSAATAQNLGVRTVLVEVGTLATQVNVPGSIAWNLSEAREISARVDGIVDKLIVRTPFEQVRAGQALARFIAPDWTTAAREYLALENMGSAEARLLQPAARQRLRVLGMDDAQIRNLQGIANGVVLHSPVTGVVSTLMVREGQRVQAGTSLMTVNGLDTVWAEAAIPQALVGSVHAGMPVVARASAFPGEKFSGTVETLIADVDATTRTQGARIVLENPAHKLVPGLFVELQFDAASGKSLPLVPDAALIATGTDSRVILDAGDGRFVPVRVVVGNSSAGSTEILEGLAGGERVVVSGQFLLDSEASLSGALDRLSAGQGSGSQGAENGHEMQGHDMSGHEMQGHDMSGHEMQGHDMSGHEMQGHDMSGHEMQDHDMSGHETQGHDMSGHETQGHDMSGHETQGHDMSGHENHEPADKGQQP